MKNEKAEIVATYLLAEFDQLHQRASIQEQAITNKVNFFLVAVTTVIGGVFVLGRDYINSPYFLLFVCVASLFMLLVGLSTFLQVLDLIANMTFYYRRAGRIRRWFFDFAPEVVLYSPFVPSDEKPSYFPKKGFLRGMDTVLILLNALLLSAITTSIIFIYSQQGVIRTYQAVNMSLLFGGISFVTGWAIQTFYFGHFLKRKDIRESKQKFRVLYPSDESERFYSDLFLKYSKDG